ncbi:response regulator [Salipiger marinus]|uniref:Regulatory protein VirG n=1 Tax=Salipiger marinus TaxID=555512 RepID=A0A1G8T251_9RHOB|nr:response regulator transcription factor [Salipiger marinus]SDJ35662.1 two component transcriptional regulator, winged helix family [Salipiger marinus]
MSLRAGHPPQGEKARIIVCDDDPDMRETLVEFVAMQGYAVEQAIDGATLRRLVPKLRPDLVLLDLNMPGEDGLSLARWLKSDHHCAILMLTAMGSLSDKVVGLEMGADDYLPKPFELAELRARIRAVLRRTMSPVVVNGRPPERMRFGRCVFDLAERQLFDDAGKGLPLTAMEYDLLYVFATHPRRVLNRDQILELAHNRQWDPYDRSVDNRIARLRKKIEVDPAHPRVLRTVRGEGYMFEPGDL